jgi:hypothetical protein
MNFNWRIVSLDRHVNNGFVFMAHWAVSATETIKGTSFETDPDKVFTASSYGSIGFSGDLTTPYEELTEAQVLEWVWGSIDKEEIESNVLKQIESQKQPVIATGLPW